MRKKYSKTIGLCITAVMSLSLGACSALEENGKGQTETKIETEATTAVESGAREQGEQLLEPSKESWESGMDEPGTADETEDKNEFGDESSLEENAALSNPIQEAESSEDFQAIGLTLELPENEKWYSGVSYAVIGGSVAQISFYDEIAESYALARAGDEKEGDISGIYYNFDDKKKESWSTAAEDGSQIYITIQVTEKNADVHGALATWSYKGTRYSLWEDDARDKTDAVAKMAIEIAKRSGYKKY